MLILLKKYKKLLITLLFPYLYLLFILVVPTNMQVVAPGGLTPLKDGIVIEDIEMSKAFHTIYVYNYYPMTPFMVMITAQNEKMTLYEMSYRQKDTSWRDDFLSGQVSKKSSLHTSLIQAYTLASEVDPSIEIESHFEGLLLSYRPSRLSELHIGDQIISINGESYDQHDEISFLELSSVRQAELKVKRLVKGEEIILNVSYTLNDQELSLQYYPYYHIERAIPSFSLPLLEDVVGGPSGGMLQTLSIYVSLLKLNTENLKISGTGTIESDGSIGRIGGVKQKIYTAIDHKVDIFFMPKSQAFDISDIDSSLQIYAVSTLREAVERLYEILD